MSDKTLIVTGQDAPEIESGKHNAVCIRVVHLGTIPGSGLYPDPADKVRLEFVTDKGNYIGQEYTMSMGSLSNLNKHVSSWTKEVIDPEKGYDLFSLLGKPAELLVVMKKSASGNTYPKIENIFDALPTFEPTEKLIAYTINDHSQDDFNELPTFIKDQIRKSDEYQKLALSQSPNQGGGYS